MFNDVMVIGCIMCLTTVFLFGLRDFEKPEETMPMICKVSHTVLTFDVSSCFFVLDWILVNFGDQP